MDDRNSPGETPRRTFPDYNCSRRPGNDHYHTADVDGLKVYGRQIALIRTLEGSFEQAPIEGEEISRINARRSLVTLGPISSGESLAAERAITKRPATGISPIHRDEFVGRKAARDLEDDHVLQWEDVA